MELLRWSYCEKPKTWLLFSIIEDLQNHVVKATLSTISAVLASCLYCVRARVAGFRRQFGALPSYDK